MKQVKFLATMSVAAGLLFLYSCKSGEKKAEEPTSDTTTVDTTAKAEMPAPAPVTSSGPSSLMTIKVKVANYAKWKLSYEGNDSVRLASGIHKYLIARGIEDSNTVMMVMRMDDVDKAKQFAASPALKARMKKGGIIGPPIINFEAAVMNDTTAAQQTVRLLIRHKVKDWDAWKKVFDSDKQARMDAGLTDRMLAHTAGDNHDVTIVFTVADVAKAKAFVNSKDLKDRMKEGGVEGAPTFWFYRIAEKY